MYKLHYFSMFVRPAGRKGHSARQYIRNWTHLNWLSCKAGSPPTPIV